MRLATALLIAALAAACSRPPPDSTPEGAVRELVDRLRRVHGDPADSREAFALLSKRARDNLAARAERYAAASGKPIAPEAMIAPSRFLLRFEPHQVTSQIAGQHALVEVRGLTPDQHARIPCVFEDGGWKVDVVLPPLPPVQLRPGVEPPPRPRSP